MFHKTETQEIKKKSAENKIKRENKEGRERDNLNNPQKQKYGNIKLRS